METHSCATVFSRPARASKPSLDLDIGSLLGDAKPSRSQGKLKRMSRNRFVMVCDDSSSKFERTIPVYILVPPMDDFNEGRIVVQLRFGGSEDHLCV